MGRRLIPVFLFAIIAALAIYVGFENLPERNVNKGNITTIENKSKTSSDVVLDLIKKYPKHKNAIENFGTRSDSGRLIKKHEMKAVLAYELLNDVGLELLDKKEELPSFEYIVSSVNSVSLKPALEPIKDYLSEFSKKYPEKTNDFFFMISQIKADQIPVLKKFPEALPIFAVCPRLSAEVINKFGSKAIELILHFTPDSYPVILNLLNSESTSKRIFNVYESLAKGSLKLFSNHPERFAGFIGLYFLDFGNIS